MNWKTKLKQLCYADGKLNYAVTIDFIEKLITADKQLLINTKKEKISSKDKLSLKIGANGVTKIVGVKHPNIIKVKYGQIIKYET